MEYFKTFENSIPGSLAWGKNPRFIVTSLSGDGQSLYEKHYCARGEGENRIKAQQLDQFADRTSCTNWIPNQVRLLLSGLAYTLIEAIRRLALKGTSLSSACCGTIRLKLFKIGAVLLKNTRRIQMFLSSDYPYQQIFYTISYRLGATWPETLKNLMALENLPDSYAFQLRSLMKIEKNSSPERCILNYDQVKNDYREITHKNTPARSLRQYLMKYPG